MFKYVIFCGGAVIVSELFSFQEQAASECGKQIDAIKAIPAHKRIMVKGWEIEQV